MKGDVMEQELMNMPNNEIVIYQPDDTTRLSVRFDGETVWLSQEQMIDLFQRDRSVISRHIANAFKEGEVDKENCLHILQTNTKGRPEVVYNLEVVTSVGYRVKSLRGVLFRRWATRVLKEYLLRGYSFNARMNQLEDKMDRRLAQHDQAIVDLKEKVDFFVQTKEPPLQSIFYQNKFWNAKSLLIKFIRRAKKELIVIDAYPGVATLDMLAKRGRGVKIELVAHSNGELEESDFEAFGAQCGKLTKTICGICHDRFIIVDQKEIFWTGASLKDAGRLTFAAAKMYSPSEASCEADSMRGARRSSPGFSNQSARRHLNDGNTARARRRKICDNCDVIKGEGFGIICA